MIRLLGLGAALPLAVLALASPAAALAQDTSPTPAEARLEAASSAFEARMEDFGKRAEALSEDPRLSEAERGSRIAALWSEYAPDVAAFTTETAKHAGEMAAEALKNIDVDALVANAMNDPEVKQAIEDGAHYGSVVGTGIAQNGAWANPDPEQMVTYGLIAQYALDQAADAVGPAVEAPEALEAPEAPEPAAPPETPRRPRV
ncbi:MAG: hypothetical protein P0Y50_03675 [Candidatus Brevundimonas colombiensis]|uniref:Uncharacterized protein n=1 Tax=Candidatus Brevundimonas colombiensis TaxID=3121376 RepID=A0AAJ5WYI1_9CAUL|nr:hypothetical protein [Brevundimonas sp.]WEK40721.1 MAG: hypothetical protein P0Y50_03675 [Brevundimonas sp.]